MRRLLLLSVVVFALGATPAQAALVIDDFDDAASGTTLTSAAGVASFGQPAALATKAGACSGGIQRLATGSPPSVPNWAATTVKSGGGNEFPDFDLCVTFTEAQDIVAFVTQSPVDAYTQRADGTTTGPINLQAGQRVLGKGSGAQITAIHLSGIASTRVLIDDLQLQLASGPPPSFSVAPDPAVRVRAGSTATQALRVRHRNGDTTATTYTIDAGSLPAGVTAAVAPAALPGATADQTTTVTLRGAPNAAPGPFTYVVRVNGGAQTLSLPAEVTPAAIIDFEGVRAQTPGSIVSTGTSVADTCTTQPYGVAIQVPPSDSPPPGPVTVAVEPAGGTATYAESVSPLVTVTPPADGSLVVARPTVRWKPLPNVAQVGAIRATVSVPGSQGAAAYELGALLGAPRQSVVTQQFEPSSVGPFTPRVSGPRWNQPAGKVRVNGERLCPGSTLKLQHAAPFSFDDVSPDGTQATYTIPAGAVPSNRGGSNLEITTPAGVVVASRPLNFQLARASSLFSNENEGVSAIAWDRWIEAYGDEVLIEIDPCEYATFGLIDCQITKVTDPAQYIVWDVGGFDDFGKKGLCFGHVMLSDWTERGRRDRGPISEGGTANEDNYRTTGGGFSSGFSRELQRRFITQASPQYKQLRAEGDDQSYAGTVKRIKDITDAGRDAWVSITRGEEGHIVRASGIDVTGDTARVHLLDSNLPYTAAEGANAAEHAKREDLSTLTLTRRGDGRALFELAYLGWKGASKYGADGVRVVDPQDVPPTFSSPLTLGAIAKGFVSATSSDGAAELVDAKGRRLAGQVDAPLDTGRGAGFAQLQAKAVSTSLVRTTSKDGQPTAQTLTTSTAIAALQGDPGKGKPQRLGLSRAGVATLPAGTGGGRRLALSRGGMGLELAAPARLAATAALGSAGATLRATGGAGAVRLAVVMSGRRAAGRVDLGTVRLRKGARLTVPRKAFTARAGARVKLRLRSGGRTRTVRHRVGGGPRLVRALKVKATRTGITGTLRTAKVGDGGIAVVGYEVRRGAKRVARGRVTGTGTVALRAALQLRKGDRVRVAGIARRADGVTAVKVRRLRVR